MIAHSLCQRGLHFRETPIESCRILAIDDNHLFAFFASPNDFKRFRFNALGDCISHSGCRLPDDAEFGAGLRGLHHGCVGRAGINRQDMDTRTVRAASPRQSVPGLL